MKNWHGKWIMIVAAIHTVFAVFSFGSHYREIIAEGLINTVKTAGSGLAVWFFLFGVLLFTAGQLVLSIEKNNEQVSKSIGVTLLLLAIVGATLMPASGFWLILPPAIALIWSNGPHGETTKNPKSCSGPSAAELGVEAIPNDSE